MFQTKEQGKKLQKIQNETEISNMPDKKFKVMVIDTGLQKRMNEVSENTKEKENIKNNQS